MTLEDIRVDLELFSFIYNIFSFFSEAMNNIPEEHITDANNSITLFGNAVITSILFTIGIALRHYVNTGDVINKYNKVILISISNIFFAVSARVGWWIPGLIFAPIGANYHDVTLTWKWLVTIVAAAVCIHSTHVCLKVINRLTKKQRMAILAANILGALAIVTVKITL